MSWNTSQLAGKKHKFCIAGTQSVGKDHFRVFQLTLKNVYRVLVFDSLRPKSDSQSPKSTPRKPKSTFSGEKVTHVGPTLTLV